MAFSDREKLAAIERELRYRRGVYPRLIRSGKMTEEQAIVQVDLFESIADDYRERIRGS